ncbi:MAG: response regulator [Nitrospina sp.]|jgi:response regulator RpfG family c-di-GMP phosphodiesterase|nr:response regulator [Nitrospina sp.]MBT6716688.1 response regulator [Nitrospina sp.]
MSSGRLKKSSILLVDDDETTVEMMETIFLSRNYDVITKLSGEEGLEYIKENPPVSVVLSDYKMGAMNGLEFLKQVEVLSPLTKRCLCSGFFDKRIMENKVEMQEIHGYFIKPVDLKEMLVNVDELIKDVAENRVVVPSKKQSERLDG